MAQNTIPEGLWTAIDGYAVGRGFGNVCPSCEQEYASGDRLVVAAARPRTTAAWEVASVVCSDCGIDSLDDLKSPSAGERALVAVELASAPMTLVLDGDTATLLDHSVPTGR
jgi:hypothetical protein